MKNYEITKEQIDLAYNSACIEWKERIKQWFPENFKKELEVGKWYKTSGCFFIHITGRGENIFNYYGINTYGDWVDKDWTNTPELFTLATHQEIETALINEAKKRGFVKGCSFISTTYNEEKFAYKGVLDFDHFSEEYGWIIYIDGSEIFCNGEWAKVLPKPTEVTLQQIADKFNIDINDIKIVK